MDQKKQKAPRFYKGKHVNKDKNAPRYSRWFCTINPHQPKLASAGITEQEMKAKLDSIGKLFQSKAFLSKVVYMATKDETHTFDTHVDQFTCDYVVEKGDTAKVGWHWHGLVTLKHRSNIRLNYNLIKRTMERLFNKKGVYFHAVVVRGKEHDNVATVRAYMQKATPTVDGNGGLELA